MSNHSEYQDMPASDPRSVWELQVVKKLRNLKMTVNIKDCK